MIAYRNDVGHEACGAMHRARVFFVVGAKQLVSRSGAPQAFDSTAIAPTGGATAP